MSIILYGQQKSGKGKNPNKEIKIRQNKTKGDQIKQTIQYKKEKENKTRQDKK